MARRLGALRAPAGGAGRRASPSFAKWRAAERQLQVIEPESAADVPKEIKEKEWGRLGVDVDRTISLTFVIGARKPAKKNVAAMTVAQALQLRDVEFGWRMAKQLGAVDVGQTVCVKDQAVLAVRQPRNRPIRLRPAITVMVLGNRIRHGPESPATRVRPITSS